MLVLYVVVRFRLRYPEASERNTIFLKEARQLSEGTPGAEIHTRVAPQPMEAIVTKHCMGGFSTTDLESVLRAKM